MKPMTKVAITGWCSPDGGEGWHNNHHADPRARHGHRKWEFDGIFLLICALEKVGLAWKVVHPGQRPSQARADK